MTFFCRVDFCKVYVEENFVYGALCLFEGILIFRNKLDPVFIGHIDDFLILILP